MCNSFFKLKVGWVAQTSEDKLRINFFAEVYCKPLVSSNLYFGFLGKGFFDKLFALFYRKHIVLVAINTYGNHNFIE